MEASLKTVKKVNIQATLLAIPVGQEVMIKTNVIKSSSLRSAVRILNKKGYNFEASEKGLIDEVRVRRKA